VLLIGLSAGFFDVKFRKERLDKAGRADIVVAKH